MLNHTKATFVWVSNPAWDGFWDPVASSGSTPLPWSRTDGVAVRVYASPVDEDGCWSENTGLIYDVGHPGPWRRALVLHLLQFLPWTLCNHLYIWSLSPKTFFLHHFFSEGTLTLWIGTEFALGNFRSCIFSLCFSLSLCLSISLPVSALNFLLGYEMNRGYPCFIPFVSNKSDKNNQHKIKLKTTETAQSKAERIQLTTNWQKNPIFLTTCQLPHLTWGNRTL